AVTRAKEKLVLVGNRRTVEFMIANRKISRRFTALDYELISSEKFVEGLARRGGSLEQEYEIFPGIFD
ncbi:MAG: hypothetical protein IJP03_03180, partial [Christensenellaceae bacterium]|nr:hypothetical protein [Christensenellaceae bacterium]